MKAMFLLVIAGALCLSAISARADTITDCGAGSLTAVMLDMGKATVQDVRDEALSRAKYSQFLIPSTKLGKRTFEGTYTPTDGDKVLFVHSDDGVTVFVWELDENGTPTNENGTVLLERFGKPQAAWDLDKSLHQLPYTFKQGKTYRIVIDYSNVVYTGETDRDGVSVFVLPATITKDDAAKLVSYRYDAFSGTAWGPDQAEKSLIKAILWALSIIGILRAMHEAAEVVLIDRAVDDVHAVRNILEDRLGYRPEERIGVTKDWAKYHAEDPEKKNLVFSYRGGEVPDNA